jgi:hypothetical protein
MTCLEDGCFAFMSMLTCKGSKYFLYTTRRRRQPLENHSKCSATERLWGPFIMQWVANPMQ